MSHELVFPPFQNSAAPSPHMHNAGQIDISHRAAASLTWTYVSRSGRQVATTSGRIQNAKYLAHMHWDMQPECAQHS